MEQNRSWYRWAGIAALAALIGLGFLVVPAAARAAVRVSVGINAPPFNIAFSSRPAVVVVPGGSVGYANDFDDADVYCVGPWWYAFRAGFWYRSRGWRGPWAAVEFGRVPRALIGVGPSYYRYHHVPAAEWRRNHNWDDRTWKTVWREDRREARGNRRQAREDRREARRDR
ncbi:MAG TPA: hypothetical protein VMS93_05880 [Candidatus Saccharimonadales bacterium]|nr:hypothetical protein [Candidatus Saccharimonadales bacterium]